MLLSICAIHVICLHLRYRNHVLFFVFFFSFCLDESPVVPQQTGGLSSALHPNWSTRVVCREEGRGGMGDGGRMEGWSEGNTDFLKRFIGRSAHHRVSP